MTSLFAPLRRDATGSMAVETAIVLPTLLLLGLGAVEATKVVTKQSQMQAAMAQAEQIIAVAPPTTTGDLNSLKAIIKDAAKVTADPTVEFVYRCGTTATTTTTINSCGTVTQWKYVHIRIAETYTPNWTNFGFGEPISLVVDRKAQIE